MRLVLGEDQLLLQPPQRGFPFVLLLAIMVVVVAAVVLRTMPWELGEKLLEPHRAAAVAVPRVEQVPRAGGERQDGELEPGPPVVGVVVVVVPLRDQRHVARDEHVPHPPRDVEQHPRRQARVEVDVEVRPLGQPPRQPKDPAPVDERLGAEEVVPREPRVVGRRGGGGGVHVLVVVALQVLENLVDPRLLGRRRAGELVLKAQRPLPPLELFTLPLVVGQGGGGCRRWKATAAAAAAGAGAHLAVDDFVQSSHHVPVLGARFCLRTCGDHGVAGLLGLRCSDRFEKSRGASFTAVAAALHA